MNSKDIDILYGSAKTQEYYMSIETKDLTCKEKIIKFLQNSVNTLHRLLIEFLFIGAYVISFALWLAFSIWLFA